MAALRVFAPMLLFLAIFLVSGALLGDFYAVPGSAAMLPALALAVLLCPRESEESLKLLVKGACNEEIMVMVFIYLLAGVFNAAMDRLGGGRAVVDLSLSLFPAQLQLPGLFLAAVLVGLALGTSMGTITALVPIARRMALATTAHPAPLIGAVLSGATCGDNLSVISDTAIAACASQGADRFAKMRLNLRWAAVATGLTLAHYLFLAAPGADGGTVTGGAAGDSLRMLPYIVTLVAAAARLDVLVVLTTGVASAAVVGLILEGGSFAAPMARLAFEGMAGELDIVLLALFTGSLYGVANCDGAFDACFGALSEAGGSQRRGLLLLAALVGAADVLCANNTVAIIIVGDVAKRLARAHKLEPARAANVLDIASCVVQALLPHGAQLLAAGRAQRLGEAGSPAVSPLQLIVHSQYPLYLGAVGLCSVLLSKQGKQD